MNNNVVRVVEDPEAGSGLQFAVWWAQRIRREGR